MSGYRPVAWIQCRQKGIAYPTIFIKRNCTHTPIKFKTFFTDKTFPFINTFICCHLKEQIKHFHYHFKLRVVTRVRKIHRCVFRYFAKIGICVVSKLPHLSWKHYFLIIGILQLESTPIIFIYLSMTKKNNINFTYFIEQTKFYFKIIIPRRQNYCRHISYIKQYFYI